MISPSLAGVFLFASTTVAQLFPNCQNGPLANNTVCDSGASVSERAKALLALLTVDEKFNLTGNTSPGVPRLGLPSYQWWNEALHGVADSPGVNFSSSGNFSYATSFPQPLLMGAAFDDDLIHSVATIVSTEARAFNNFNRSGLDYWTPNINPYKDPRWGRGQETPGEDPFHLQSYVKALINGLQGGEDSNILKVIATPKHWVAYDLESWHGNSRNEFDAIVSTQDLSEYYMPPFQAAVRDAKAGSIMCSYNALNGVPTCADSYILQDILRDHWNWTDDGNYVTSDCDAIQNIYMPHNYASTREQAVADALIAGTDLNCGTYYQTHLPAAYQEKLFNETYIDQAVIRLVSALIKVGYFDSSDSTPYRSYDFADVATPAATELAQLAAEEGIVLLKNDGVLPMSIPVERNVSIALVGPWANATNDMQGNYFGVAPFLHSLYYAASQLTNVNAIYGGTGGDPTTDGWVEALNAAKAADIVIYADGTTTAVAEEGLDRNTISWSGAQVDLITELAGLGKPLILCQMGDQLDDEPFINHPNISAILWGGYPGQSGGDALMNIITGKTAPAGRLPVTQYPADYVNIVAMTDMTLRPNTSNGNPGRTYKWYDNATIPFGYGLHYTNFSASFVNESETSYDISQLVDSCDQNTFPYLDLCQFAKVSINVTNTGNTTSDYVTLLFLSGEFGPQPYPIKSLVAYQRLFNITAGSSQMANLNLTLGSLARRDENGNAVIYPGDYSLLVDVPTQATYNFTLSGDEVVIDHWPQRPNKG